MAARGVSALSASGKSARRSDGRAGVEDGAGPDVGLPLVQVGLTGGGQVAVEDVGALLQLADRLAEAAAADLVAADDERGRAVEVEAVEQRQGRDQRRAVGQAAAQGGQAEGGRGADAAEGADQPQTDATIMCSTPFGITDFPWLFWKGSAGGAPEQRGGGTTSFSHFGRPRSRNGRVTPNDASHAKADRSRARYCAPRDLHGPEAGRVVVEKLHVEELKSALPQPLHQMHQRHLRPVADAREHRLAGEQAADRHAVDAAAQLAVAPDLDAVRLAEAVQRRCRRRSCPA